MSEKQKRRGVEALAVFGAREHGRADSLGAEAGARPQQACGGKQTEAQPVAVGPWSSTDRSSGGRWVFSPEVRVGSGGAPAAASFGAGFVCEGDLTGSFLLPPARRAVFMSAPVACACLLSQQQHNLLTIDSQLCRNAIQYRVFLWLKHPTFFTVGRGSLTRLDDSGGCENKMNASKTHTRAHFFSCLVGFTVIGSREP